MFKSVKTGLRYTDHDVLTLQNVGLFDGFSGDAAAAATDGKYFTTGKTLTAGMDHWKVAAPNVANMLSYTKDNLSGWAVDRSAYSTINEENSSFYVMGNFEAEGVRGNLGFRYINTDASSDYYAPKPGSATNGLATNANYATTLSTAKASYDDVLPSFNVAFDLADDLILRASAAKVMTRANYNDMFAHTTIAGYDDNTPDNGRITTGNIGLLPFTSNQADIGLEWYYGEGNLVSIAYFTKSVQNFTTTSTLLNQKAGVTDPDNEPSKADNWTINTIKNGNQGDIQGIEFQLQHNFANGFGGIFNYTYADANADKSNYSDLNGVMSDSSKNSLNLVGFYENDTLSARAAYNWRSAYFIRETGFYGNREAKAFGSLDLSFSYHLTTYATLTLDASNVLKEDLSLIHI